MAKRQLKSWPLYTLLAGFVVPTVGIFGYALYETKTGGAPAATVSVTRANLPATSTLTEGLLPYMKGEEPAPAVDENSTNTKPWAGIYGDTVPMAIGDVAVEASVADTWPERIQGLSNTPYLPEEVVKLFVFDSSAYHSIWMKDMNYAIDIIWVSEDAKIVHIAKNVPPESYPETFSPSVPALYVIETAAGFADTHSLTTGTVVKLPAS